MKNKEREKIMGEILSDLTVNLADELEVDFPSAEKVIRSTTVYQNLEQDPNLGLAYSTSVLIDSIIEELLAAGTTITININNNTKSETGNNEIKTEEEILSIVRNYLDEEFPFPENLESDTDAYDEILDQRIKVGFKLLFEEKRKAGHKIVKYDREKKQVFIEYPDGSIEYQDK